MSSHYTRTNHKGFFAVMTEAKVGVNDFSLFARAEVKHYDQDTYSPVERIWDKF